MDKVDFKDFHLDRQGLVFFTFKVTNSSCLDFEKIKIYECIFIFLILCMYNTRESIHLIYTLYTHLHIYIYIHMMQIYFLCS